MRVSYVHLSDDVYGLQRVLSGERQVGGARIWLGKVVCVFTIALLARLQQRVSHGMRRAR